MIMRHKIFVRKRPVADVVRAGGKEEFVAPSLALPGEGFVIIYRFFTAPSEL